MKNRGFFEVVAAAALIFMYIMLMLAMFYTFIL